MNAQEKRLTEEQSAFAEKHHHVVMDFLRRKRLPESEFYDVVIFRYLRAVQLSNLIMNISTSKTPNMAKPATIC